MPRFGRMRLSEIHQLDVAALLARKGQQGLKPGTIERMRVVSSHSLKLAKAWGLPCIDVNPLVGIPRPPLNNLIERRLIQDELARLRKSLDRSRNPQLKFIAGLLLFTGVRISELLHARWQDFDLERRIWTIPLAKSGKARHVPLSTGAVNLLAQLPRFDGCPYVVPNPDSKKPFVGIFMSWDTARKKAGLPTCCVHDLRHTAASLLVDAGVDLYYVGKIIGHANYKTTQHYAYLANSVLLASTEALSSKVGVDWSNDPDG